MRRYPELDGTCFEIHAGADYVDGFERACRWLARFGEPPVTIEVLAPLRGLAIGRQLAWYPTNERRS